MIVQILENLTDFYSRPRVGGDYDWLEGVNMDDYFYSRPRVGGDAA